METIALKTARKLTLAAQGLLHRNPFGSKATGTLACLQHLGYVQIDTISVVQRAHHHVLWSRVPTYHSDLLERLQRQKQVFEYWSHAAAYLPMRDFRYYLPAMHAHRKEALHWFSKDHKMMENVYARVKTEGRLSARDFQNPADKRNGAWWDWKPAKKALEQLFMEGRLMVAERVNFQKVYDLPERVLPATIDTSAPSRLEMAKFLVLSTVRAHGFASEAEISYLRSRLRPEMKQAIPELLEAGALIAIEIEAQRGTTYYALPDSLASAARLRRQNRAMLLSPFDNAVIRRKRLQTLFDFDYQLECYLPQHKRTYGYFCLPILWGDQFVGRADVKAERQNRRLLLQHLVFEKESLAEQCLPALAEALWAFAAFNGCDEIAVRRVRPVRLSGAVKQILPHG